MVHTRYRRRFLAAPRGLCARRALELCVRVAILLILCMRVCVLAFVAVSGSFFCVSVSTLRPVRVLPPLG